MLIRRRTISLLGQRREQRPRVALSSSTDPNTISRSNWNSWRALLRILGVALSVISIGCIAWAYTTGPKSIIDHYVSDGQDVPWVMIPVSTLPLVPPTNLQSPISKLTPTAHSLNHLQPSLPPLHRTFLSPYCTPPHTYPPLRPPLPPHPLGYKPHLNFRRCSNASMDCGTVLC